MIESLRIAIWGLGSHAIKNILPAIQESKQVHLVGVCTRDESKQTMLIQQFPNALFWTDPKQMLNAKNIDLIYICTPTGLHAQQIKETLEAGKHCLCEKSMTTSYQDTQDLIMLAKEKALVLAEAFMYQHHPLFHAILRIAQQDQFGEICQVMSRFGIPMKHPTGFRSQVTLGGGAFFDLACYPLSFANRLFKMLPNKIVASLDYQTNSIDMSGTACLFYEKTHCAQLSWGYDRSYQADISIWGSKQSLYAEKVFSKKAHETSTIILSNPFGEKEKIPVASANSFVEMFISVQQAIDDKPQRERFYTLIEKQADLMKRCQAYASQDSHVTTV